MKRSWSRSLPFLAMMLVGVGVALSPTSAPSEVGAVRAPEGGDPEWRRASVWDDGNAEFAVYRVKWSRYGRLNPGRVMTVVVKEPWHPELDVKADEPGPDSFDVLKLNYIRDVPTGIYTYHQMASVFFRRDDGRLRKLAAFTGEACGLTTADMTRGRLRTRSYWDGFADRELAWPAGAIPEDGLPAMLREWVRGELPASVSVFPSLMQSKHLRLQASDYRIARRELAEVKVPAGTRAGVEIRLENESGWMAFVFDQAAPHMMLHATWSDGTVYELAKGARLPYWEMHDPGDERWIPGALR